MKRLILEMGSGVDLYGKDYTKAAARALESTLRGSSLTIFKSLNFSHEIMEVKVTIGVQEPERLDAETIRAKIPRGRGAVSVVFGGQNINHADGSITVVASCAVEAFVPELPFCAA